MKLKKGVWYKEKELNKLGYDVYVGLGVNGHIAEKLEIRKEIRETYLLKQERKYKNPETRKVNVVAIMDSDKNDEKFKLWKIVNLNMRLPLFFDRRSAKGKGIKKIELWIDNTDNRGPILIFLSNITKKLNLKIITELKTLIEKETDIEINIVNAGECGTPKGQEHLIMENNKEDIKEIMDILKKTGKYEIEYGEV